MSPSHHTRHADHVSSGSESPRLTLATPIVALIVVLRIAAKATRAKMSRSLRRVGRNPTQASSDAPTTASSVFPAAIPSAVYTGTSVVALAANAPTAIAGHIRRPPSTSATSASPVGG